MAKRQGSSAGGSNGGSASAKKTSDWPKPGEVVTFTFEQPEKSSLWVVRANWAGHDEVITVTNSKPQIRITIGGTLEVDEPGEGDDPIIVILQGWAYVFGSNVSVGTDTVSAAAEGSKLIVDATSSVENPGGNASHPRVLNVPHTNKTASVWQTRRHPDITKQPLETGKQFKHKAGGFDKTPLSSTDSVVKQIHEELKKYVIPGIELPL